MAAPVKKQNKRNTGPDGWNQNDGDEQTLQIDHGEDLGNDLFSQKVLEFTDNQTTPEQYRPVVVDEHILKSMRYEEVYVLDLSHFSKAIPKRYFKNMSPEIAIMKCENCCKFFIQDEYEFAYMESGHCPFCKNVEKDKGVKAVYGSLADMQ